MRPSARTACLLVVSAVTCAVALGASDAGAAQPKALSVFGLALGPGSESVRKTLTERYPRCAILPSVYHASSGYPSDAIAILDIARGTLDVCRDGPPESEVEDSISVNFAHPAVDPNQPLYQIDFQRSYPDVMLGSPAKIRASFDKIRAELFRTYGVPVDERRERTVSASADLAKSLSLGQGVKREDYLVRYLWAERGRLVDDREFTNCDCGARYVKAELEISRSPSTIPKNQFYVLSLKLFVRDAEIGMRQDAWNAQWQRQTK
jgi:hypothetical protein